jgi:hypothetical protein
MQKLQCVQDGSSTIANISSKTRASTGHNATQAAQPKQRSLSTTNIELSCLATLLRGGVSSQLCPPTPLFPLQLLFCNRFL